MNRLAVGAKVQYCSFASYYKIRISVNNALISRVLELYVLLMTVTGLFEVLKKGNSHC